MSDSVRLDVEHLKAARLKYLQLGREIERLDDQDERANLMHTHSKLGMFLEEAIGSLAWRGVDDFDSLAAGGDGHG
jgi:hypothetical protein